MMKSEISERIRILREKHGWTQADFAEKSGISPAAISQFENGGRTPSAPILKKLASTLNTTSDYLLGIVDSVHEAEAQTFYRDMRSLSEKDREQIFMNIEFLKNKNKK